MPQTALAPERDPTDIREAADVARLPAEERLVILASCGAPGGAARRALRARPLAAEVDWHRLARIAADNRVLAPVVREVADVPGLPAQTRRALGLAVLRMERAAACRRRELERLLRRCSRSTT